MTNFSKYIFAPWVRQGMSNNILEADQFSGGVLSAVERAELNITLNWTESPVSKIAQLLGPGDINSISEDAVLKYSPIAFNREFERNYLPFIEFYEEDFPWRYTPAKPTLNNSATDKTKLRPWIALVVLKDDNDGTSAEFTFNTPQDEQPFITVTAAGGTAEVFHPSEDHWAWAHVQYNPETSAAGSPSTLISGIKSDPDRALSRIMCPRRLEADTNYRAFLIPAFETGRLAGLGVPLSGELAQKASWGSGTPGVRPDDFPVYKEWSFRTAPENDGDFETLAKKLRPFPFNGDGGRNMAIGNSGYGVQYAIGGRNVKLEGALKPTDTADNIWPDPGTSNADDLDYIEELSNVLNLNESLNPIDSGAISPTIASNPFSTAPILDDPIVSPPIYGQWHFLNSSLPDTLPVTGTDKWFSEINLNPAWRAAAGLGTKIIRDNQESFMERAWQQVGEINKANEIIRLAELTKWTSKRISEKRFDYISVDRYIKMNSSLMKRVQNGSGQSIYGELRDSELSEAIMDNGFRKMVRPRGVVAKKASASAGLTSSYALSESIITNFEGVTGVTSGVTGAIEFSPAPALTPMTPAFAMVALSTSLSAYSEPVLPPFDLDGTATSARELISKRTDNFYQVARTDGFSAPGNVSVLDNKVINSISVLDTPGTSWSPVENRKPIMAYPKFTDIIGDLVKNVDVEYILPEISKVDNNSVTLMETNPRFLEALLLGLNHEMGRELLWREFPTDQRGTYFRQFWDKKDVLDPLASIEDIKTIDDWDGVLGSNTTTGNGGNSLVLVVKGDLLRKYPDAIIYAQKAGEPTVLNDGIEVDGVSGDYVRTEKALPLDPSIKQYPIFSLTIDPDITIIGFDLEADDVANTLVINPSDGLVTSGDAGWYFVFAERPGKPRFGLDVDASAIIDSWSDLSWPDMGSNDHIEVSSLFLSTPPSDPSVPWGASSAEMAYITFQKPALVAIHGEKMLPSS
ncbi:MAG: hypothetical protein AB8B56_03725 [Crocinitomicaceae bacterium]